MLTVKNPSISGKDEVTKFMERSEFKRLGRRKFSEARSLVKDLEPG